MLKIAISKYEYEYIGRVKYQASSSKFRRRRIKLSLKSG